MFVLLEFQFQVAACDSKLVHGPLSSISAGNECSGGMSIGDYNMSYLADGDVRFNVAADTTGWVAIGFSTDQLMVSIV